MEEKERDKEEGLMDGNCLEVETEGLRGVASGDYLDRPTGWSSNIMMLLLMTMMMKVMEMMMMMLRMKTMINMILNIRHFAELRSTSKHNVSEPGQEKLNCSNRPKAFSEIPPNIGPPKKFAKSGH